MNGPGQPELSSALRYFLLVPLLCAVSLLRLTSAASPSSVVLPLHLFFFSSPSRCLIVLLPLAPLLYAALVSCDLSSEYILNLCTALHHSVLLCCGVPSDHHYAS